MSFRIGDRPNNSPKPHRSTQKTTTPNEVFIQNGNLAQIAFPCYYIEVDPPERIDVNKTPKNVKEPSKCKYFSPYDQCRFPYSYRQGHKKCSNCKWLLDLERTIPIHLKEEYTNPQVEIKFLKEEDGTLHLPGLTAEAYIDPDEDHIIRVDFSANCPSAIKSAKSTNYTLTLFDNTDNMRSVVLNGRVMVLPGIV